MHAINGNSNDWDDSTTSHFLENERRLKRNFLAFLLLEVEPSSAKIVLSFCVLFLVLDLLLHCKMGEWVLHSLDLETNWKCVAMVILTT